MFSYRPYKKGYLQVSDGHSLYYEMCGNPKGKPALFLHGGPGTGFSPKYKRLFDPNVWNILLFDQRGSGKSIPYTSIHENNTWKLVEDITAFLKFANISRVFLVGGSWGATLALVYAISHSQTVYGMILIGIFLAGEKDFNYAMGDGVKNHFPEVWESMVKNVPVASRNSIIKYYYDQVISNDDKKREFFSYEWAKYEMSILKLNTSPQEIEKNMKSHSYKSMAVIGLHYYVNSAFLPENYILKNINKILNIPVTIIQGRYDLSCCPENAYILHQKLKQSKLFFTIAGHSSSEKETNKKIVEEIKHFSKIKS